jgi:hypothetical protein
MYHDAPRLRSKAGRLRAIRGMRMAAPQQETLPLSPANDSRAAFDAIRAEVRGRAPDRPLHCLA